MKNFYGAKRDGKLNQFNILHKSVLKVHWFRQSITNCPSPIQSNYKDSLLDLVKAHAINFDAPVSKPERKSERLLLGDAHLAVVVVLVSSEKCFWERRRKAKLQARCARQTAVFYLFSVPKVFGFKITFLFVFGLFINIHMYEASFGACFTCALAPAVNGRW